MKKLITAAVVALLPGLANAHTIKLLNGQTYDYSNLVSPDGHMCCGGHDCGPVAPGDAKRDADGNLWIRRPGTYGEAPEGDWHEISAEDLPNIMLVDPSPDGRIHACIWGHAVRCLLMPNGN
jgi:hypothetical protein